MMIAEVVMMIAGAPTAGGVIITQEAIEKIAASDPSRYRIEGNELIEKFDIKDDKMFRETRQPNDASYLNDIDINSAIEIGTKLITYERATKSEIDIGSLLIRLANEINRLGMNCQIWENKWSDECDF